MNVYLVRSVCEREVPGRGLRQVYAAVDQCSGGIDGVDHFDGRRYPKRWRPVTLRLDKPHLPRADFVWSDAKRPQKRDGGSNKAATKGGEAIAALRPGSP